MEASSPRPPVPPSPRLKVAFWRIVTRLRYRLLARRRFRKLALEEVAGRPFVVLPEVFNPKLFRTSEILVRALGEARLPADCSVLDMGTGSGVGAVFAAQSAGRVVAVDINPEAVRCARINALLNHVEDRVEVLRGDLFAPVAGQRFDAVLFNPPFYRGAPRDRLDMAWRSADAIERFAEGLPGHLAPGGWALVVLSTDGEEGAFLRAFQAAGLRTGVAARQDLGNEVVTVYRVRDQGPGARGLEGEAPAEPPVGMGIPTPPGSRAWMPDQVRHDIVAGAPWRSRVRHDGMGGEGFA